MEEQHFLDKVDAAVRAQSRRRDLGSLQPCGNGCSWTPFPGWVLPFRKTGKRKREGKRENPKITK